MRVFCSSGLENDYAPQPKDGKTAYRYAGLYKVIEVNDSNGDIVLQHENLNCKLTIRTGVGKQAVKQRFPRFSVPASIPAN